MSGSGILDSMFSVKGCWVISSVYWQLGQKCSKPASECSAWLEAKEIHYQALAIDCRIWRRVPENPVDVLTQDESDARVGALSFNELDSWILRLWGFLPLGSNLDGSPRYIPDSVGYAEWLSYCITWNHCFGVVHAGVTALLRSWTYRLLLPPVELDRPNSVLCHGTCICIDGVHTANWEAPVFEREGYKMLNIRKHDRWIRRVWDICANRVIPWADSLEPQAIVPISHAWVDQEDREYIATSVNYYLWPVPLPRGVQLEDIRAELIQHNVRYAWLDVLCLRQEAQPQLCPSKLQTLQAKMRRFPTGCPHSKSYSGLVKRREKRRIKEWEVDVPFISNLYMRSSRVFVYLSGLGRPFNANQDWDDSRNWLRRAWTLQETKPRENTLIGGLSEGMDPWACKIDKRGTTLKTALLNITLHYREPNITHLFSEMRGRIANSHLDRIWGLYFPYLESLSHGTLTASESLTLPLYDGNDEPEHAWQLFVHGLAKIEGPRAESALRAYACPGADTLALYLLSNFPHPSSEHWFPSFYQVHAYPNVSLQEPQLDDQKTPSMNAPLSIKWGRLYQRVRLITNMARGTKSGFWLASAPGYMGSICLGNINPESATSLGLISGQTYTLLDLTPFYSHQVDAVHDENQTNSRTIQGIRNCHDAFRPIWNTNLIIVCRELSEWNPPSPGNSACLYQYRLRRVTSLIWRRDPKEHWLPFEETIRTMLSKEIDLIPRRYLSCNLPREWCIPNPGKGEPLQVEAVLQ